MRSCVRSLTDPYGNFLPSLLYHDVRDRLGGRRASANARWGWLSRPAQAGKLIWICAGASRNSVRLGVELARAIVARRLDVMVTLTFEAEHPDLLEPLARAVRINWGYGPADYVGSINALWRRLMPFALVIAGVTPRRNLLNVAAHARHALLVAPPRAVTGRFERIYPTHAAPCPSANSAPATDLDTLLTQAQVEPTFAAAVNGGRERKLWWWHGADAAQALRFVALFRGHLPGDLLFLSGPICSVLQDAPGKMERLSSWDRTPITQDALVLADEARWLPALGACAMGVHFATPDPDALWQALAGGAFVSTAGSVDVASPQLASSTGLFDDDTDVALSWAALRADPIKARIAADASRRAFWAERRLAQDVIGELLERVLKWD
jgi:hypothetical protein